jgi:hypothetical protein
VDCRFATGAPPTKNTSLPETQINQRCPKNGASKSLYNQTFVRHNLQKVTIATFRKTERIARGIIHVSLIVSRET